MAEGDPNSWRQGEPVEKLAGMMREAQENMPADSLQYDEHDWALPPWKAYPEIPRFSIGWRMGYGEGYWVQFWDWYRGQDTEKKSAYRSAYPEPEEWYGYYDMLDE